MEWVKELWTMLSGLQIPDLVLSAAAVVILDLFAVHIILAAGQEAALCGKRWQKVSDDMELCRKVGEEMHHYPLEADEILLGRHTSADIRLNHPSVSRYHAVMTVTGKKWSITDLNSRSGIYVNDKKIRQQKKLSVGDCIQLGEIRLYLQRQMHETEEENEN